MSTATQQAVLFEIDEKSWDTHLDRVERWFHHVQTVQTAEIATMYRMLDAL